MTTTGATPDPPTLQGTAPLGRLLAPLGDAVFAANRLSSALTLLHNQIAAARRTGGSVNLVDITDQYVDAHCRAVQAFAGVQAAIATRNAVAADTYPVLDFGKPLDGGSDG